MPRAYFPTTLGPCAVAWDDAGLTRFELPGAAAQPGDVAAPPVEIASLITRVQGHLAGGREDFAGERFAFAAVPEFPRRVYQATLAVKPGHTASYGDLAAALNLPPGASRAVGVALGANPWPLLVPCHRIVAASGKMTGFSGPGGVQTKTRLLALEGAQLLSE